MNTFAGFEMDLEIELTDRDSLRTNAFDVDLDPADLVVVERMMSESPQIEIAAEFAVYACEQV